MDFKTYAKSHQTTVCLELDRVAMLLSEIGNPDASMCIVHVAGTNGKGSVCSFVCEGLKHMGKKTGRFSSPELFDVTDTITVDAVPISRPELDRLYDRLAPLCARVKQRLGKAPSQFEINFAAALLHFQNCGCTHAVIECGMGGAGDATNAITDSSICVLNKISLDHEAYLGSTVAEIAANKCGIFKASSHIVTGSQEPEVLDVIGSMADGRPLTVVQPMETVGFDGMHCIASCKGAHVRLSLAGVHQAYNAAVAAEVLSRLGADSECIGYALENASNPARLEQVEDNVYFDGAHNPDGVSQLVNSINMSSIKGKLVFVTGFMADKDYHTALRCLQDLKNRDFELYAVCVHSNPRSETAAAVAECGRSLGFCASEFPDVRTAVTEAKKIAGTVFVFGSLYMYKEYVRR